MRTAITVLSPRSDVERLWREHTARFEHLSEAEDVSFVDAPGDRGTEIQVTLSEPRGGKLGEIVQKVAGAVPLAQVKDELRHFKQLVEVGVITRSDAVPEGEQVGRKLKRRPGQPLEEVPA